METIKVRAVKGALVPFPGREARREFIGYEPCPADATPDHIYGGGVRRLRLVAGTVDVPNLASIRRAIEKGELERVTETPAPACSTRAIAIPADEKR